MTNEDICNLNDQLYRDDVRFAREMPPEQKFLAGAELFDYACRITLAGIRSQNPEVSEERVQEILRERLAWKQRREEGIT